MAQTAAKPVKHKRISAELMDAIREGAYRPGDRLPTERELSEQYGVHRMTVRQATATLVRAGLVERRRPLGIFVRESLSAEGGVRHLNLICIGHASAHADAFIEQGVSVCAEAGYQPRVVRVFPGGEHAAVEAVRGPDASIVIGASVSGRDELGQAMRAASERVVLLGCRLDHMGVASIVGDDELGLRTACDYLHEKGHPQIGLITSLHEDDNVQLELQINLWRRAMAADSRGRESIDAHVIRLGEIGVGGPAMAACNAVQAYCKRQRRRATAFIALSEEAATGAIAGFHRAGLSVPRDVSLLAYATTVRGTLTVPALTGIDVGLERHLRQAIDFLEAGTDSPLASDAADAEKMLMIRPELVERESVASRD
ncbi:MAG: GntR family transcriptional regulator [Planctomycetota bacterium]